MFLEKLPQSLPKPPKTLEKHHDQKDKDLVDYIDLYYKIMGKTSSDHDNPAFVEVEEDKYSKKKKDPMSERKKKSRRVKFDDFEDSDIFKKTAKDL